MASDATFARKGADSEIGVDSPVNFPLDQSIRPDEAEENPLIQAQIPLKKKKRGTRRNSQFSMGHPDQEPLNITLP